MSETVFILGAGVSYPAGAPSMKDFIDAADGLPRAMSTMTQRTLETRIRFPTSEGGPRPQYIFEHLGSIVREAARVEAINHLHNPDVPKRKGRRGGCTGRPL